MSLLGEKPEEKSLVISCSMESLGINSSLATLGIANRFNLYLLSYLSLFSFILFVTLPNFSETFSKIYMSSGPLFGKLSVWLLSLAYLPLGPKKKNWPMSNMQLRDFVWRAQPMLVFFVTHIPFPSIINILLKKDSCETLAIGTKEEVDSRCGACDKPLCDVFG